MGRQIVASYDPGQGRRRGVVDGYVIMDDHVDVGDLRARLILIHPGRGLQLIDVPRILELLMRPLA